SLWDMTQDDFGEDFEISAQAFTLIRIIPTPLQAILLEGSPKEIKRGWHRS
ncbi:Hypothetical protein FKW44_015621, partial [Caligus rogercresseyi]